MGIPPSLVQIDVKKKGMQGNSNFQTRQNEGIGSVSPLSGIISSHRHS